MTTANFSIIFEGPAVDNGEIDVRDLAPSLLALGDLIQGANDLINGDQSNVSVKLQATGRGSVEVFLSLAQDIAAALDILADHGDGIAAAKDLVDLIFRASLPVVGTAGGLFALIKWLRRRKPEEAKVVGGQVHLHIGDQVFITDQRTIQLAESVAVRENAKRLVSILERKGINCIGARIGTEESKLSIEREDVVSFEIPDVDEEELSDEEREMHLQIASLSFQEGNKWRLTDGGEPFYVEIADNGFLNRIAMGEISFSKNDHLRCRVRERQYRTAKGQLRTDRTVLEVLEFRPGARQLSLI